MMKTLIKIYINCVFSCRVNYQQETVAVFFVDWGDMEIVAISQLRPLVSELLDIPCLALCCRLAGVYPYLKSMVGHFYFSLTM